MLRFFFRPVYEFRMDDARKRLLNVLPHIRIAIEMAKIQAPDGKVFLAIGMKRPDGSGRLTAEFEQAFLDDVALLLGVADKPGWLEPDPKKEPPL